MFTRHASAAHLASLTFASLVLECSTLVNAQDKVDISLMGYKPPVVQGKANELRAFGAFGRVFSLQAVEIVPPDGVSVREIRESAPQTSRGRTRQVWSIVLYLDKTAQLEERQLVFVTPLGGSAPETFRVADHVPAISNLKAWLVGSQVRLSFLVTDEAADLSATLKMSYGLQCGSTISGSSQTITNYFKENVKSATVEVDVEPGVTGPFGARPSSSSCTDVSVSVSDRNEYSSNEVEAKIAPK